MQSLTLQPQCLRGDSNSHCQRSHRCASAIGLRKLEDVFPSSQHATSQQAACQHSCLMKESNLLNLVRSQVPAIQRMRRDGERERGRTSNSLGLSQRPLPVGIHVRGADSQNRTDFPNIPSSDVNRYHHVGKDSQVHDRLFPIFARLSVV